MNMSSKEENIIAKEQNPMIEYKVVNNHWLKSVIKDKRFDTTKITDKGIVTAKLGVKLPKSGEDITVIVWKNDYIGNRLTPWMNFHHKNVMPLLHTESIPSLNALLIYSISADSNILRKINSKEFRCAKDSPIKLVQYMKEVTDGLNYLHEKGYAHLNIKPSSIALLKDGTIKIDQFHFINNVNSNSTRNGLPQSLCPPETFYDKKSGYEYPKQFDSWSVGIMIVELFTGGYLTKKLPKYADSWCLQVYPVIFKILKKKNFDKHVHRHFPGACKRMSLNSIRYLISNTLTLHPNDRPTIEDIHKKLTSCIIEKGVTENTELYSVKPKIWERRMHWTELLRETAQVTLERQEHLNEKLISANESALKIVNKTESVSGKTVKRCKEVLADDCYRALREEILEGFGRSPTKVPPHKDIECPKIYITRENDRKEKCIRDEESKMEKESTDYKNHTEDLTENPYIALREEMLQYFGGRIPNVLVDEEIECSEIYEPCETDIGNLIDKGLKTEKESVDNTTFIEENKNNGNARSGNIFSRLISFGTSTLKCLSDPWSPENPDTYLNKLSKKLTR